MRLDELAVDAGDVDLPDVDPRPRVAAEPVHHGQQALPVLGQCDGLQGTPAEPVEQGRLSRSCQRRATREPGRIASSADQGKRVVERVDPDGFGQALRAEHAMIDRAPGDPQTRDSRQLRDPGPHGLEPISQVRGAGSLQPQAQRESARAGHAVRDQRTQQLATLPESVQLRLEIRRRRPAHAGTLALGSALRALDSSRYSSIVRLRSLDSRPPSLCTKPTAETKGSMMWIFCSGVTISSCRLSC